MNYLICLWLLAFSCLTQAANIAYIYGDVAADGTIPSGAEEPYDQMLLDDTGPTGLSTFKTIVQGEGHTITQHYDAQTTLTANFLDDFSVVIFGLHQKAWNSAEKAALDNWLKAGGGMLIYSDSASGGFHRSVGAQNTVGQTTTNNLISQYGMQIAVDQANGNKDEAAVLNIPDLTLAGLILEGEGVSPVAVSSNPDIHVLIPFTEVVSKAQNITITNPDYAALALRNVENGHITVMFDRQPMWNGGAGSDITQFDNEEILRRLVNFLAQPATVIPPVIPNPSPAVDGFHVAPIILLLD